ncbi:MAG: hypothetical protein K2L56_01230 [Prevotella sp.]|nr:hypothetical protein [Prevotella sp.]
MKKTFELVGMWLMAMVLCCNFTACSSDDDDNEDGGGGANGGKRLVSIKYNSRDSYTGDVKIRVRRFEYDNSGRIVKDIDSDSEEDNDCITTYEYGEKKITRTIREDPYVDRYEYSLRDGRIVKLTTDSGVTSYKYDGNKLINGANYGDGSPYDLITWDGDNIATCGVAAYTYSNLESSIGWNEYEGGVDDVLYNQGYFGDRSRNLMATGGCIDYGAATSYTYEVNGGYVTKAVGSNGGSIEYVWE